MFKDKGILKALWAGMFILCCVMGFIPTPTGATAVMLSIFAVLFFVPPFADLYFSWQRKDTKELRLVRNLSIISLSGTTVLLVATILSTLSKGYGLGNFLQFLLVIFSTPFVCGQYAIYSLFLWAALLWCCILALRKLKK